MKPQYDPQVVTLMKAIKQHESGGNYKARGGSKEFGAYQYTQPTWQAAASKYFGNANLPPTPENQDELTYRVLSSYKQRGLTPAQIAATWNAGEGSLKNDAWKTRKGVNKYGVQYDTPAYVNAVVGLYNQFKGSSQTKNPLGIKTAEASNEGMPSAENPIDLSASSQTTESKPKQMINSITGGENPTLLQQGARGILKSGASTVSGMQQLGSRLLRPLEKGIDAATTAITGNESAPSNLISNEQLDQTQESLRGETGIEKATKTVGDVGQFFVPSGQLAKGQQVLTSALKARKASPLITKFAPKIATNLAGGTGMNALTSGEVTPGGASLDVGLSFLPPVAKGLPKAVQKFRGARPIDAINEQIQKNPEQFRGNLKKVSQFVDDSFSDFDSVIQSKFNGNRKRYEFAKLNLLASGMPTIQKGKFLRRGPRDILLENNKETAEQINTKIKDLGKAGIKHDVKSIFDQTIRKANRDARFKDAGGFKDDAIKWFKKMLEGTAPKTTPERLYSKDQKIRNEVYSNAAEKTANRARFALAQAFTEILRKDLRTQAGARGIGSSVDELFKDINKYSLNKDSEILLDAMKASKNPSQISQFSSHMASLATGGAFGNPLAYQAARVITGPMAQKVTDKYGNRILSSQIFKTKAGKKLMEEEKKNINKLFKKK